MLGKLNDEFWKAKKVLVTGHTGFKGAWLTNWLVDLGAEVTGYSLAPNTTPSLFSLLNFQSKINHFEGDIRDAKLFQRVMASSQPEIVIHLAAQPIVSIGYDDPVGTFETNIMGVVNLLDYFRKFDDNILILIVSSDKCYLNNDSGKAFEIKDPLGGHDPYSASKAGTEIIVSAYTSSFFKREPGPTVASVRAGNVIGGGDWSINRLIPDAAVAFSQGKDLSIRNPLATRPWQHVLEPLYGYLILIEAMAGNNSYGKAWNFGPDSDNIQSVKTISMGFSKLWGGNANVQISENKQDWKEAKYLNLDVSKTHQELKWKPVLGIDETLKWSADWYKDFYSNPTTENVRRICSFQISEYTALH